MNNRLSPFYKNIALWLLITLIMIFLFNYFNTVEHAKGRATINYSKFVELVKADKVVKVTLQGEEIPLFAPAVMQDGQRCDEID